MTTIYKSGSDQGYVDAEFDDFCVQWYGAFCEEDETLQYSGDWFYVPALRRCCSSISQPTDESFHSKSQR